MRVPKGPPRGSSGTSLPTRALPWHGDGKKTWGRSHVSSSHGAGGTKRRQRVGGSSWRCPCAAGTAPSPAAKRWRGGNPVPAGGSARPQHSPPRFTTALPPKMGSPSAELGPRSRPPGKLPFARTRDRTSPVPPACPAPAPFALISPPAARFFGFLPPHCRQFLRAGASGEGEGSPPPPPPKTRRAINPVPSSAPGFEDGHATGAPAKTNGGRGKVGARQGCAARPPHRKRGSRTGERLGGSRRARAPPFPPARGCREASGRDNSRRGIRRRKRQPLHVPSPLPAAGREPSGGDAGMVLDPSGLRSGDWLETPPR